MEEPMFLVGGAAFAATVCPADPSATPSCDHPDLAAGLASTDVLLELLPGKHVGGLVVARRVDLTAQADATLAPGINGGPILLVTAGGAGSTFAGLSYDADSALFDPPLLTVQAAADITVADLEVDGARGAGPAPALVVELGATVALFDPRIVNTTNTGQGVVHVQSATLGVYGGTFEADEAYQGGAIWAGESEVTLVGTTLVDSVATSFDGNALWIRGGSLTLDGVVVVGGTRGADSLWEVHLDALDATITGGAITTAAGPGFTSAIYAEDLGRLDILGTRFAGWPWNAVYAIDVGVLTVGDAIFEDNHSPDNGGALSIWGVGDLAVDRTWFCANGSLTGGAIDLLDCSGTCSVTGSVFQTNAGGLGGAIAAWAPLSVDHCTFRGNSGVGGAIFTDGVPGSMTANLIVEQGVAGAALDSDEVPAVFVDNAFGGNLGGDTTFVFSGAENLTGLTVLFDPTPGRCGEGVTLALDGNDDWLFDHGVGAIVDQDRDGAPSDLDCDDTRSEIHPGAIEIPADGTDQDCDGTELCPVDGDGDGYGTDADALSGWFDCASARGDCDDSSPIRHPGAPEAWYDGIDADCLGDDDFDQDGDGVHRDLDCDDTRADLGACEIRIGGGCRTVPGGGRLGLVVIVLFGWRRCAGAPGIVKQAPGGRDGRMDDDGRARKCCHGVPVGRPAVPRVRVRL